MLIRTKFTVSHIAAYPEAELREKVRERYFERAWFDIVKELARYYAPHLIDDGEMTEEFIIHFNVFSSKSLLRIAQEIASLSKYHSEKGLEQEIIRLFATHMEHDGGRHQETSSTEESTTQKP